MHSVPGLAAVLFDMDGLLVDTEPIWLAAEHDVMDRLGGAWGPEHQATLVGGPMESTVSYMISLAGRGDPAEVEQWLVDGMAERMRTHPIQALPGAVELLDALAVAGIPTALVSSSFRVNVDAVLAAVGTDRFAASVAGDEVFRRKPDPEGYLTAADRLGADPRRCVVLEDSENGARAGQAAGCLTIVIPSVAAVEPQAGRMLRASLVGVTPGWLADQLAVRA